MATSAQNRIRDTLAGDLGRALVQTLDRTWTVGEILGAAAVLRPLFLAKTGPVGVAFAQPGCVLAALLAAWASGRLPVLIDPALRREAEALRRSYPDLDIYTDAAEAPPGRVALGRALAASAPAKTVPAWLTLPADHDPFVGLLTSASTGENKIVDKLALQFYRQAEAVAPELGLSPGGLALCFVPPFHILGLFYGLVVPLMQGAVAVFASGLGGGAMVELLARLRPALVVGIATHYRFLTRAATPEVAASAGTLFLSSGAPLDPAVAEEFATRFGTGVREYYGSTETGGVADRTWPAPYRAHRGVRWRIDPATARLEVCSPWGGGPEDAWVATDDAAEAEGDGFRLLGRLDHVVKVGGKRFSTVEVEHALRTMPGVAEAAVFAYPRFGEPAIAAALVPEPGSGVDDKAARAFLAARLAPFKLPRTILVLSALPKGSHDKVDYPALRDLLVVE
jgi:long-chain acyl-CoA synthetase